MSVNIDPLRLLYSLLMIAFSLTMRNLLHLSLRGIFFKNKSAGSSVRYLGLGTKHSLDRPFVLLLVKTFHFQVDLRLSKRIKVGSSIDQ